MSDNSDEGTDSIPEGNVPVSLLRDPDTGDQFLIYIGKEGATTELRFEGEQPWFTQAQISRIFGVDIRTANDHVLRFVSEGELDESTIRKIRIVRQEGTRRVEREIEHYGLDVAFYVGYRVNSRQGAIFRRWATGILIRYATKGFVIDDKKLKSPGNFDRVSELREIIRDIRASEANLYAELRRICSLCQDYDPASPMSRDFYTRMQAKIFWATVSKTPSMVLMDRADSEAENMGVQIFAKNEVLKNDTGTAKNYLFPPEIKEMNRLTSILLDIFEDQLAIGQMTLMGQAVDLLDKQLANLSRPILRSGGSVSHSDAERHVNDEYRKFDMRRKAKRIEEAQREISSLKATEKTLPKTPKRSK